MRLITLILILLSLSSCNQKLKNKKQKKNNDKTELESDINETIKAIEHSNIGVILTSELVVYDIHKTKIRTINNLYGEIVTIDSISKEKYDLQNSGEKCNLLNFVKIRSEKINGWVYSSNFYEKQLKANLKRDTSLIFNKIKFEILPTKNFNIGVYDDEEDMLSFCGGNDNPVILYNSLFNKYEPIVIENLTNEKDIYSNKYLTLDSHDGWYDKIISSTFSNNILTLEIKREFQEGEAIITIEIKLDKNKSFGKVTNYNKKPL